MRRAKPGNHLNACASHDVSVSNSYWVSRLDRVASHLRSDRLLKADSAIIIIFVTTLRCPVMLSRSIIYERSPNF